MTQDPEKTLAMAALAQQSLAAIQSGNTIPLNDLQRLTQYFLGRSARKASCASCVVAELKACIAKSAQMLAEFLSAAKTAPEAEQQEEVALAPNGNAIKTKRKNKKSNG